MDDRPAAALPRRSSYVRASELSEYAFCAHAWWLQRVAGVESDNSAALQAGAAWHVEHGRRAWLARMLRGAAMLVALAVLVIAILSGLAR